MSDRAGRPTGTPPERIRLTFGPFRFDPANGILSRVGEEIRVAPRPLGVLRCLLNHRGDVVSKQQLMDEVWSDAVVEDATLAEAVAVLRRALGDKPRRPTYIQTLHGRGYRFIAEVASEVEAPAETADSPVVLGVAARESRTAFGSWSLGAALVVAAVMVGYSAWPVDNPPGGGEASTMAGVVPAEDLVRVLISDLDDGTAQSAFDAAWKREMAQALTRSGFATAVPRHQVNETLRLMRRPPDSAINAATGREISLRDGETRALVTSHVQPLGAGHVLTVEIVDPVQGVAVANVSHEMAASHDVTAAARAVADRTVAALQEQLPLLPGTPQGDRLPRVTTASLRALELYQQAGGLLGNRRYQGGKQSEFDAVLDGPTKSWLPEMYEEAVLEDPNFPSALIMLAWAIRNTGGAYDDYIAHAEQAAALAEDLTEAEEYWIRASYEEFRGNIDAAVTNYKSLLLVEPDHEWALGNIVNSLQRFSPRFEEAVPYEIINRQDREGWLPNTVIAGTVAIWGDDPERAEPYVQRALDLLPEDNWGFDHYRVWPQFYRLHQLWLKGDVSAVLEELDKRAEALTTAVTQDRWSTNRVRATARGLGSFYLTLGKLAAAESAYGMDPSRGRRLRHSSLVAAARRGEGDLGDVNIAPSNSIADLAVSVTLRVREDNLTAARILADALDERWAATTVATRQRKRPYVVIARAALALGEGRLDDIETAPYSLARAVYDIRPTGGILYFRGAETESAYWKARGDLDEARHALEDARNQRARSHTYMPGDTGTYLYFAQSEWTRVSWKLAVVNRKLGRSAEARAIEDELRGLLAYADADMWLFRRLQALEEAGTIASLVEEETPAR